MNSIMAWCAVALLVFPARVVPHDGPVTVLNGTVSAVERDRIQLDTFDPVGLRPRSEWIALDAKTKFLEGKKRVEALDLKIGQPVDTLVQSEDAPDGSHRLRAVQIRVKPAKQR